MLTLHARLAEDTDEQTAVSRVKGVLRTSFGIDHSTVQVERGDCPDEVAAPEGTKTAIPTTPTPDR